jgi:hypothetical protein
LAGLLRKGFIRNDIIRSQLGEISIMEGNEKCKLQWRDHLLKMENTRFSKIA